MLRSGSDVLVHCRGGLGRAGTISPEYVIIFFILIGCSPYANSSTFNPSFRRKRRPESGSKFGALAAAAIGLCSLMLPPYA